MAPASVLNPSRFADALAYATTLHAKQRRKGTDIPYIAHLLGVASLALEHRPDEDLAIAALLHDAVEDQGGAKTLRQIRRLYGDRARGRKHPDRVRTRAYDVRPSAQRACKLLAAAALAPLWHATSVET